MHVRLVSRYFIPLLILIILLAAFPVSPAVSAEAGNTAILVVLSPIVKIYEGDTVTIPYMVQEITQTEPLAPLTPGDDVLAPLTPGDDALAPLTPGDDALAPLTPVKVTVSARQGNATVTSRGMSGTIRYTARAAGVETLSVTVDRENGSAPLTGSVSFKVYPKGNYAVTFMIVAEGEVEGGLGGFREVLSGGGNFTNKPNEPIKGTGRSDAYYVLWANTEAFACGMTPLVSGSSFFNVSGTRGADDGEWEPPFTLDLNFDQISMNASTIHCVGLGDLTIDFPWPAYTGPVMSSDLLTGLNYPPYGGVVEIIQDKVWGVVYTYGRDS